MDLISLAGAAPLPFGPMPRQRLGVVLLIPAPAATEIDGIRRALGDPMLERIAPHVTLVPPINVRTNAIADVLVLLRDAASARRPFVLDLGPPRTFAPDSPTLYLSIGGSGYALAQLASLREDVFRAPLARDLERPFTPHVTIGNDIADERGAAARVALADYATAAEFASVHLLEQQHRPEGRQWVPVADVPFGSRVIVGRGGVELELTTSTLVDPEAMALLSEVNATDADQSAVPSNRVVRGVDSVVVTARRHGRVVGVASGQPDMVVGRAMAVVVARDERRQGIARQLVLALRSALDATASGHEHEHEHD